MAHMDDNIDRRGDQWVDIGHWALELGGSSRGSPTAHGGGAESAVAHKWADWLHTPAV